MPTTSPTDVHTYSVTIALTPTATVTADELEDFTIEVESIMREHAHGDQFGASAACSYDPPTVEIDLSFDAVSLSLVNQRVAQVMAEVEQRLPVQSLQDQQIVEDRAKSDPAAVSA